MTRVSGWVAKTCYNIGCGLAGGILSQTRLHGVTATRAGIIGGGSPAWKTKRPVSTAVHLDPLPAGGGSRQAPGG